jgi:hypothetical protein
MDLAARFPRLWHVTAMANLPGIATRGLWPAGHLHPEPEPDNRDAWLELADGTLLRRQNLRDAPLATRLAPGLTPASWRRFINGHVFFFTSQEAAQRLRRSKRDIHVGQVILRVDTAALAACGLPLLTCRFNNGYLDRAPEGRRRLRAMSDYAPWNGGPVREVAVPGVIPPELVRR